jgi:diguanylate cyclase (GGDEF)-like protein/PAS domain S-box-containing protein
MTRTPTPFDVAREPLAEQMPGGVAARLAVTTTQQRCGTIAPRRALGRAARSVLDLTTDAVFFFTAKLIIVDANVAAIRTSEYPRDQLRRMNIVDLLGEDEHLPWREALAALGRRSRTTAKLVTRLRNRTGGSIVATITLRMITDRGTPLFVAVVRESADESRCAGNAQRDFLTSLPNRAVLDCRLRHAESQARLRGSRYAILFVDVDHFKLVNDVNGHRAGDVALQFVADRLRACVRPSDVVVRYGGDEFVVLMEHVATDAEVNRIAARVRRELDMSITIDGKRIAISASVGVAIARPPATAQELVDEADRAMYSAKRASRHRDSLVNAPHFFPPS